MESLTVAKQLPDKRYKSNNINRDVEYTFLWHIILILNKEGF